MSGVSKEDFRGALACYDELLGNLGFRARLLCDEFRRHATYHGKWACTVEASLTPESGYGKMLWMGTGHTSGEAREDALRALNREYGSPLAFSEEEALIKIEAAGAESFRPACEAAEAEAKEFESRW